MTIQVGERIPDLTLNRMGDKGPEPITTREIFAAKKVVLFALPGAFTPTCSKAHLPGYVAHAAELKAKGIDTIACLSVNDAWVMDAWGKAHNAGEILMLADGSAVLTRALGLELDLTERGFGLRSERYAMVVDNGVVTHLKREAPRKFEVSDAVTILKLL
jgi:peroxiredoxin